MYIYDICCERAEEVEIVKDVLSNVSRFMRSVIQIRFHEFNGRERCSKEKTAEILLPTVELSLAVKRVSDYERFCFLIIKVGVIYIQTGENPRVLAETLASYMGLSAEADFKERTQIFID